MINYEVRKPGLTAEEANHLLESVIDCFYRLKLAGDSAFPAAYSTHALGLDEKERIQKILNDADLMMERLEGLGILEISDV